LSHEAINLFDLHGNTKTHEPFAKPQKRV